MKIYKTRLIIFLLLAIIISLFPPYEMNGNNTRQYVSWKEYEFLFSEHLVRGVKFCLLYGELVIEYLLAGFIAFFVQIIITFTKRKTPNEK